MKNLLFFVNHIENSITKTMLYYFLIIMFTVSGFMLGATSNIMNNRGELKIGNIDGSIYREDMGGGSEAAAQNTQINQNKTQDKSLIFASVKGKYFYYRGCGGTTIAAKNLRYYKSEADAVKAGKILYDKCK